MDPDLLAANVKKHAATIDKFLAHKPTAAHTVAAYEAVMDQIRRSSGLSHPIEGDDRGRLDGLVLDSGCGTGRSSLLLGQKIHPDAIVIGVDRSLVRLAQNNNNQQQPQVPSKTGNVSTQNQLLVQHISPNVWLVRAELVDFWRLLFHDPLVSVQHHYMLYPNPYPKRSRLSSRWYGHASFPLFLQVASHTTTIRSNWELYLEEMATATRITTMMPETSLTDFQQNLTGMEIQGPYEQKPMEKAWTNFEQKYWNVGERTFELVLRRSAAQQTSSEQEDVSSATTQ